MDDINSVKQFFDDSGRIIKLPRKHNIRLIILEYLATKFEPDTIYTEKQINEICSKWHTFDDYFLLRRELVDYKFLGREKDGSKYWLEKDKIK